MKTGPVTLLITAALATPLAAQNGDRGDKRAKMELPADFDCPPAPVVPPSEALGTFVVQPGLKLELVAAEPLVNDPVDIAWDADGRLWVAEMTGYMPTVDGEGEREPVGTVAVLEDTDGDSIMDKRTTFLDGLVLPRSLAPARGGILVGAPPSLRFCRDTDGDLKCDEETVIDSYSGINANVEHSVNALRWNPDNWLYCGKGTSRYRYSDGGWVKGRAESLGQWGLSHDDWGRWYYNSNSNMLSAEGSGRVIGNAIYPVRVTPGVNRGYGWVHKTDRLGSVTGACGPGVYRGGAFPEGWQGNVFVCEPCANLVARIVVEEVDGKVRGRRAYEKAEFLASHDERFRPVNVRTGPDGGIYIVDMYRGIVQHRIYMTTWLRQQVLARGLDKPTGLGRIYRVLPEGTDPGPRPSLSGTDVAGLVRTLEHPNGWWRDTAQRLLVERGDKVAAPALREMFNNGKTPQAQLHALCALDGIGEVEARDIAAGLAHEHPKIRGAAVRIVDDHSGLDAHHKAIAKLLSDPDITVQRRAATAFVAAARLSPVAEEAFAMALSDATDGRLLDTVADAADGDETRLLLQLLSDPGWGEPHKARTAMIKKLATRITDRGEIAGCTQMLDALRDDRAPYQLAAALDGIAGSRRAKDKKRRLVRIGVRPAVAAMEIDQGHRDALERCFLWPGREGFVVASGKDFKLDAKAVAQLKEGETLYGIVCAVCHKADGTGQEALAPPLAGSEWVEGSRDTVLRAVIGGVKGPIEVAGEKYELEMPPLGGLPDDQIAAIVSYVSDRFGREKLPPLTVAEVKAARAECAEHGGPWSAEALDKLR